MAGSAGTLWTEKLFKVLVIGDIGVGKSSIVLRYVNKRFDERYKASIGVDFALKSLEWDPQTVVRVQLWDIAGECQEFEVSVAVVYSRKPIIQTLWHLFYRFKELLCQRNLMIQYEKSAKLKTVQTILGNTDFFFLLVIWQRLTSSKVFV